MTEKKLFPSFPGRTVGDIWYNLKQSLKNLKKFFWVIWGYRGMDFTYSLEILKECLQGHLDNLENDSYEVEKTRLAKIKKIERAVELINNIIDDNYYERCGYDFGYDFWFDEIKDRDIKGEKLFELKDNKTEAQTIANDIAIKKAAALQKKEWKELWKIIHNDMQGWWS